MVIDKAEFVKKMGDQGRLTIPKEYRDLLDIEKGDMVRVMVKGVEEKGGD